MDAQKRAALEVIIRESQKLRTLAASSGQGFLAFLLENVLHEARATLIGAGHEAPDDGEVPSSIVAFPSRGEPRGR